MAFTSKKLLSGLALASMVSMTAANVVACGFTLDRIINREQRTNVLNNTFAYSVTSWNTAYTMQAEDHKVLANTFATPLARDEYQRTYGDIFESNSNLKSDFVGNDSTQPYDASIWNYTIRENASWTKQDRSQKEEIVFGDFWRTAEFVLKTSKTQSQTASLWRSFILGADEIYNFYNTDTNRVDGKLPLDYSLEEAIAKIKETDPTFEFGLSSSENPNAREMNSKHVRFKLTKPAPYFESLLCYSVFAPVHRSATDDVKNFKDAWYSGAFIPTKVNGVSMMTLEKNENYHFKDIVTIDKINFKFLSKAGSGATRTLFESGDTTGFTVSSADTMGWNRYIGSDLDDPVFTQMYDVPNLDSSSSFVMYFNSFNGNISSGDQRAISASKLLQLREARELIATGLNRSRFVKYYSEKFDGGSSTSKMIRNLYVAPQTGVDGSGKDYTKYAEDVLYDIVKENDPEKTREDINLTDGNEVLLNQSESYTGESREELIKTIADFVKTENLQTNRDGKVVLQYLTNPEHNSTLNPSIGRMFDEFNSIPNNPIVIETVEATSESDYKALAQAGKFDLYNGGWGPDYADPSTFLATLVIGGDLSNYTGTTRAFDQNADGSYEVKSQIKTSVSDEFVDSYESYTDSFTYTDQNTIVMEDRLHEFAEQEIQFLYQDFLMIPFYNRAAPKNYQVSHVIPYSASYENMYGLSAYKEFTKKISPKLPTAEEIAKYKEDWLETIAYNATAEDKGKSGNIFWETNNFN